MTTCDGAPARLHGLQYVEQTLPEFEVDRFEEHYFSCPVCLNYVRTIQVAAEEFSQLPAVAIRAPRRIPPAWPVLAWSLGPIAALLLIGLITYKSIESKPPQPSIAQNRDLHQSLNQNQASSPPQTQPIQAQPAPAPTHPAAAPVRLSQLADLTLPGYLASTLRGEKLDARFVAGMRQYAMGNCEGAVKALSQLPAEDVEARAATFYSGACQLHLGNYDSASALLLKVADAGESPQMEAAIYLLAQVSLAQDNPDAAQAYLERTISLHGDLEERAQAQKNRIAGLQKRAGSVRPEKPDSH